MITKTITVHSFRRGAGKSNIVANVATLMAKSGLRVGIIDTDIQALGIPLLFDLEISGTKAALNDFLRGKCRMSEAVYDRTAMIGQDVDGAVFVIPSRKNDGEVARMMRDGFDVGILNDGCGEFIAEKDLDILLIDIFPGLNEETLLAFAVSDKLVCIMRPENQEIQGTAVTVEVARNLNIDQILLVANEVPLSFDTDQLKTDLEASFQCKLGAILPYSRRMSELGSRGIFATKYPHHTITVELERLAVKILR